MNRRLCLECGRPLDGGAIFCRACERPSGRGPVADAILGTITGTAVVYVLGAIYLNAIGVW